MATQRRFEGSTLAAVLAKVQKEIGPNASIASAQRVRNGGVGGFFAREKFEVIVNVPDPGETAAAVAANQASTSPPTTEIGSISATQSDDAGYDPVSSLLNLAEKISKEDINEVHVPEPKVNRPQTEQASMETTTAEAVTPNEHQISTESDSFAEVLSRVAYQAHMTEEQERAAQRDAAVERSRRVEDEIPGRPAFLDAKIAEPEITVQPEPEIQVVQEPAATTTPATTTPAATTPAATETPATAPVATEPAIAEPSVNIEADPVAATTPVIQEPASKQQRQSEQQAIEPAPKTEHDMGELVVPQQRTRISDHPLAALGLPTEYIPVGVGMDDLQQALTAALERLLPKPPDVRPSKGSVIAVVGDRMDAMEVAAALADQFGRPAEEIVLASQIYSGKGSAKVLRTVRNAEDAQRSWSRRPRPTIVAIEATPGSRDASWAEHLLTALEPIATYGVADATRKSDDIRAWVDSLGGVDCLAVNNVEETVSPAAVLATGIPIDRVDGRRVSAAFWALLLTERLLAA